MSESSGGPADSPMQRGDAGEGETAEAGSQAPEQLLSFLSRHVYGSLH